MNVKALYLNRMIKLLDKRVLLGKVSLKFHYADNEIMPSEMNIYVSP